MGTSFSFADLIPEPVTFRDNRFGGDDQVYDVKTSDMLSAVDIARLQRLQGVMAVAMAAVQQVQGEQGEQAADKLENIAQTLEQAVDGLFLMLIQGLPAERVQAIPFAMKLKFLDFWKTEQVEEETPVGGKPAGQG